MHQSGPLSLTFKGHKQGFGVKNCQNASRRNPAPCFFVLFSHVKFSCPDASIAVTSTAAHFVFCFFVYALCFLCLYASRANFYI